MSMPNRPPEPDEDGDYSLKIEVPGWLGVLLALALIVFVVALVAAIGSCAPAAT